ncbi:Non-catalytic module family EXPN protein [Heterobasidion irregulare TC 32-1]|uniref:Non-catalytic module family EXPN protein n=1 Tax=Heterobasidion irregulare (strain TC 32-1) TaxID=747525 RepID=W4JPF3_HETIT|nr:Non-catalytic module family EXPN protein [Heterobasidion irregulare TC 32-1]ETW75344.1 Non-catalytic module family EXPN protein [Heterobasidion irregulare TC 32-1]
MAVSVSAAPAQLSRRDFSGQGTFYVPGLGACGVTNTGSDLIVAISAARFDSTGTANPNLNPLCGKRITANFQGKSVTATVVDRCPGCAVNDLDFSPAAFDALADPSLGRIDISWNFI